LIDVKNSRRKRERVDSRSADVAQASKKRTSRNEPANASVEKPPRGADVYIIRDSFLKVKRLFIDGEKFQPSLPDAAGKKRASLSEKSREAPSITRRNAV